MRCYFIGLLLLGVLISCKPNENINTGHVAACIYKEFYPNGKIKYLANKVNDSLNGNYYTFYESGKIKSIDVYFPDGFEQVYFDSNSKKNTISQKLLTLRSLDTFDIQNRLPIIIKVNLFKGIGTLIQTKLYDENGQLIFDSSRVQKGVEANPYGLSVFFYKEKVSKGGNYNCISTATYTDIASNVVIARDTFSLQVYSRQTDQ